MKNTGFKLVYMAGIFSMLCFALPITAYAKQPSLDGVNPTMYYLMVAFCIVCAAGFGGTLAMLNKLAKKYKFLSGEQGNVISYEEVIQKDNIIKDVKKQIEDLVTTAPLAYVLTVNNGDIIESNQYAQNTVGFMPGTHMSEYYYKIRDREQLLETLDKEGTVFGDVIRLKMKDGSVQRHHINVNLSRYGDEVAAIVWCINVEESEKQKDAYRRAQSDLQKVIDSLPLPMFIVDPKDITLLYGNDSFKNKFGVGFSESERYAIDKILPPNQENGMASKHFMIRFLDEVLSVNDIVSREIQHQTADGTLIEAEDISAPIVYNGQTAFAVVMQDVSMQKKQEEMLRNAVNKEKEVNELKNRFIVNMSHEIRTPMNAIIGLSDVELMKHHSQENYEIYKKINVSAKILLTIINDILDFSKIEAQRLDIIEEEFVLEESIEGALLMASQHILNKQVEMLVRTDRQLPQKVIGDKTRVWQILKNILDNSAKFTSQGKVVLTVDILEKIQNKVMIQFKVADTGKGMNKGQLEKIYFPFEQFGKEVEKATGTGLGMPITKQLVELMGGHIQVESKPGIGTITTIQIPFTVLEEAEEVCESCNLQNKRILIVDDEPLSCEIMKDMLDDVGAKCVTLTDCHQVVDTVLNNEKQNNSFDLIILDYMLGDVTGIEVADELKKYSLNHTKLLMVSAYAKRILNIDIKEKGFCGLIDKPFVPTEFYRKVCYALELDEANQDNVEELTFSGARVLLCEDNEINQDVAIGILEMYGIQPVIASNGMEGLIILKDNEFDLVLMDILMPVLDGHDTIIQIRNTSRSYRNVPIVAMTANAMKEETEKCFAEGANGYISKPIDIHALEEELIKWLSKYMVKTKNSSAAYVKNAQKEEIPVGNEEALFQLTEYNIRVEEGITRFGGNIKLYKKALGKFVTGLELNPLPVFDELVIPERLQTSRREIHTLKGTAGNLAISGIYESAIEFENTLKAGEPDRDLYEKLIRACEESVQVMHSKLQSDEIQTMGKGDETECKVILARLKDALELSVASQAEEAIEELKKKTWDCVDKDTLTKLYTMVDNYEYEEAIELIEKI